MNPMPTLLRPQRRRVFFGCEGESERSYGTLLNKLLDQIRRDVHLDAVLLRPGGGDHLALVERAGAHIKLKEAQGYEPYLYRALLLDSDRLGQKKSRDNKAIQLASQAQLRLIWQDPCHEAFLLRHIDGCSALRPKTTQGSMRQLLQRWPNYKKGLSTLRLSDHIDMDAIFRALSVESELAAFLAELGFF
jgi:hypothetical protein